jgi:hypothetical protein
MSMQTVNVKCVGCDVVFSRHKTRQKYYCSPACKKQHRTIECECLFCGKKQVKPKSHFRKYCSRKCNALHRELLAVKIYTCPCGNPVRKAKSYIKYEQQGVYCSIKCCHKYRAFKSRSLNEELFYNKLKEFYPSAIANVAIEGREADVLLEDLKIAVHWNGAWHYRPLRGKKILNDIQRRDHERYRIFEAAGFSNYIIKDDNSHDPSKVQAELDRFLAFVGSAREEVV